jgi:hypothetical protein
MVEEVTWLSIVPVPCAPSVLTWLTSAFYNRQAITGGDQFTASAM